MLSRWRILYDAYIYVSPPFLKITTYVIWKSGVRSTVLNINKLDISTNINSHCDIMSD